MDKKFIVTVNNVPMKRTLTRLKAERIAKEWQDAGKVAGYAETLKKADETKNGVFGFLNKKH